MQPLRRRLLLDAFRAADLCAMTAAFGLALLVSAQTSSPNNPAEFLAVRIKLSNVLLFAGYAVLWHVISRFTPMTRRFARSGAARAGCGNSPSTSPP